MATYDAHTTISQDPLIPADVWDWMSAGVRASSLVILMMLTLLFITALLTSPEDAPDKVARLLVEFLEKS